MIYCIPSENYPKPGQFIEEIIYPDENGLEWRIARTVNGFVVKYFGDDYFKDSYFSCETDKGEHFLIKNTGCIFFQDTDFETFCAMRDILKNEYTDDIWDAIREFFEERLNNCPDVLESELA